MNRFLCSVLMLMLPGLNTTWAQWSLAPQLPHGRHANAVSVTNQATAVIVGGNQTNDVIRSIFVSTDWGGSWNFGEDVLDQPWLKALRFSNPLYGIASGDNGSVIRTTDGANTWDSLAVPPSVNTRVFNAIAFAGGSTFFLAGGQQSNDSIQTILKSTDGGNTWNVQRDSAGAWLKAIFFTDTLTGYASGEGGVMLKTTDGGAHWTSLTLTGNLANRYYNGLYFRDALTGFAAGGYPTNDSIQTLIKTTDGGATWNVIMDSIGPMLNAIAFAGNTTGYAVGNRGAMFSSTDTGNTWAPLNLPFAVDDTLDLLAVDFLSTRFGVACGRFGKVLTYLDTVAPLPQVLTLQASNIYADSARLNIKVNANGLPAVVSIEYGTTLALGNTQAGVPDTVTGTAWLSEGVTLHGLIPNTFYYYRASAANANGTSYGNVVQFYVTDCEIPNCDFESWDTAYFPRPVGWNITGDVQKVALYDGSNAVQLSGNNTSSAGAIGLGNIDQYGHAFGGVPVSGQPDSIEFYARYDIVPGDTAFVLLVFVAAGVPVDEVFLPLTGSTGGNFVPVQMAINYTSGTTPDSLVLGIVSSNIVSTHGHGNPASVLAVDNVILTPATSHLPDWNFEQWDSLVTSKVAGWTSQVYNGLSTDFGFDKTTDRESGRFALQITSAAGGTHIYTGPDGFTGNSPAFPVAGRHSTLNMFIKYLPQNNDTLAVSAVMFSQGVTLNYNSFYIDTAMPVYTPVSFTINYSNQTDIPDSAFVSFQLITHSGSDISVATIDNLSFDGFRIAGLRTTGEPPAGWKVYPNPATGYLIVETATNERAQLDLYDLLGAPVYSTAVTGTTTIDVSKFAPGIYLLKTTTGNNVWVQRVVVER